MNKKVTKELLIQEAKNKRSLSEEVARSFLGIKSPAGLVRATPLMTHRIKKHIAAMHKPSHELADSLSEETHDVDTVDVLFIQAAALGIVSSVIGATRFYMNKGDEYRDALLKALEQSETRSDRIATTETFSAFNGKVEANLKDAVGVFKFDATLDKRTCERCDALHGKEWTNINDVPFPPLHPNCRCQINFIPT